MVNSKLEELLGGTAIEDEKKRKGLNYNKRDGNELEEAEGRSDPCDQNRGER